MKELLSAYEKDTKNLIFCVYAQEMPAVERKLRARFSHFMAWDMLGAVLQKDFGIRHSKITRTGLEKPQLVHDSLHMNLSHCDGLAVCAVGIMPVGIDCEPPRQARENILPRICTPEECACILAQEDQNFMFSRIWTLKEAYGKWNGEGIRAGFQKIGFSLEPHLKLTAPDMPELTFFQLLRGKAYSVSVCIRYADELCVKKNENWEMITNGNGIVLCESDC